MGRDKTQSPDFQDLKSFNSRARMGRDGPSGCRDLLCHLCFNSRARMGRDVEYVAINRVVEGFNSRARMGRDYWWLVFMQNNKSFNSRARMGRDEVSKELGMDADVSIHAPAWGATSGRGGSPCAEQVSIHAPAWGATGHEKEVRRT